MLTPLVALTIFAEPSQPYMVLVGYNKEQYVVLINFNHMTILLKKGVLVALSFKLTFIGSIYRFNELLDLAFSTR